MGLKVAVLMGGSSFEREFSLSSGRKVIEALESAGHCVVPLDTTSALVPTLRSEQPDVVYSALHGKHGEDGTVASLLELLGERYVGSSAPVARSAYNKATREHRLECYRKATQTTTCAKVPQGICIAKDAFKDMGAATALDLILKRAGGTFPLVVKPARGGSAMGVHKILRSQELGEALLDALSFDSEVIVEQWIDGVELAVSLYESEGSVHVLPPVEIVPREGMYDTDARLDPQAVDYFAPPRHASLGKTEEESKAALHKIQQAALEVFNAYAMQDIARVDMIWDGTNAYILEANVSPGMTELSLFPMACAAQNLEIASLLDELVKGCAQKNSRVVE